MTLADLLTAVRAELTTLGLISGDSQVYAGFAAERVPNASLSCWVQPIETEPASKGGAEVETRSSYLLHFFPSAKNRGPGGAGLAQAQQLEAAGPALVRRWDGSQNAQIAAGSTASGLRLAGVRCRVESLDPHDENPSKPELVLRLDLLEAA